MKLRYLLIGILLAGGLTGGVLFLRHKFLPQDSAFAITSADTRVKGSRYAPVKIIEYSDFQCPACQKAQEAIHQLFQRYPGNVQLAYRHFPLVMHQWAGPAHHASECAHEQGKFWPYHDRLYADQSIWSVSSNPVESFIRYAREAGLDLDRFASCLTDEKIKRRIVEEREKGRSLKITSTPTFFFNGERIVGPIEFAEKGEAIVRKALGLPVEEPKPMTAAHETH